VNPSPLRALAGRSKVILARHSYSSVTAGLRVCYGEEEMSRVSCADGPDEFALANIVPGRKNRPGTMIYRRR
jgi:hypothetical protein